MSKSFKMAFEKISLSSDILNAFEYVTVDNININKEQRIFNVKLTSEKIVSYEYRQKLRVLILNQFPVIEKVILNYNYIGEKNSQEELFSKYWQLVYDFLINESKIIKGIMKDSKWKLVDGKIQIFVRNNMAYIMSYKEMDKRIQKILLNETGENFHIQFKDSKENTKVTENFNKQKENKYSEFIANSVALQNEATKESNEKKEIANAKKTETFSENLEKGIILGNKIKEKPISIMESKEHEGKCAIRGNIYNVEYREIKGEKYIVSFDINDKTDSTTIKFFIDKHLCTKDFKGKLKTGEYLLVHGDVQIDKFSNEIIIMSRNINTAEAPPKRMDLAEEKRVELHLHTQMSTMDGITPVKEYIKRAIEWGHKAIAITDHGVVQAFPDAMNATYKSDLKVIYGVEAYLINDLGTAVTLGKGQDINTTYIVFDIETTGLLKSVDGITEIACVKIENGEIKDTFSTFVNPKQNISEVITKLTGIDNSMVADAPTIDKVLPEFLEFVGDGILVAHNAEFDMGFIRESVKKHLNKDILNTTIDTLELARCFLKDIKNHKLNTVCKHLDIELDGHHRAIVDAKATAEVFLAFVNMLKNENVKNIDEINVVASRTINYKKLKANHCIILVENLVGLRNLYELISVSHINYFFRRPRIPKSLLMQFREGLIIGSACEAGELFRGIVGGLPDEVIGEIVDFYDYLEIQPIDNNEFMIRSDKYPDVKNKGDLENFNKRIIDLGTQHNKPVVATCDVHFLEPEDKVFRKIIMASEGFSDAEYQPPIYFRTTEEMLREFEYLGEEKAYEVVVKNTNLIADRIEKILPIPDGTYAPTIDGADDELRQICLDKAYEIYGNPLPSVVSERLDIELNSIISNGYAVLYIIAQKLVWKSMEDGYLVGSRGSVGSSFAANMAGITEVNSLPPHYICTNCKYSDFDSEVVKSYAMEEACGCDMPDKECPQCGEMLYKDGHDIPFQTFLGFEGDKEPDIDLNFSGEYQQMAHSYTEELFGEKNVYKAGTIGTLAEKSAYGLVKKYFDANNGEPHSAEVNRLKLGCTGIKRTTGQHPGGLMVVPQGYSIYEFTPVQRPANKMESTITTTHFDYHSISGRLLKLDLLGHDDPTIIRMLHDLTGVNPQTVSLGDKATMSLFESPNALGVTEEDIGCKTGTLGVPEFGTQFVRGMLVDTKPQTFSDLLRISGLSHGTDVWLGNAKTLIDEGTITLKDTISTRDGIMIYLINKGVDKKKSFKIMENVRKGKGLTPEEEEDMKACGVPDWYIWSCKKIKYMFPKAHAAAYVMMAFRIAYFKVNYPKEYYATYFTIRASDDFDYGLMCKGIEKAKENLDIIKKKDKKESTAKDKNTATVLELVIEFYARGFTFEPMDLYKSQSSKFLVTENGLLPPFNSLQGLGTTASESMVVGREDGEGEFRTIEELKNRTAIGKSLVELLKEHGVLDGMPETNQLDLFSLGLA